MEVSARIIGSWEYGWVGVPAGFAGLPTDQQRRRSVRLVHQGVMALARARGWDPILLARAVQRTEDRFALPVGRCPCKSAPDRRHRARAVAGIADDGFGRVHLEVAAPAGELTARSEDFLASGDGQDLVGMGKTVYWDSPTRVVMTAIMDPLGLRQCRPSIDLSGHAAFSNTR